MFDTKLFEFANFDCANDYVMARESLSEAEVLDYVDTNNLRVDSLVFKPKTNQVRLMFLPCKANNKTTQVYNINSPTLPFLRRLWDLEVSGLQRALAQYVVQSDMRHQYDNLEDTEKTWISAVILGAKEE